MNLQTIRHLEDALTAFGAGKNVTIEMSTEEIQKVRRFMYEGALIVRGVAEVETSPVIHTPGGFVITIIEKP